MIREIAGRRSMIAIGLARLANEPLIIYLRHPRPSYPDQVISLFHDRGLEPQVAHEVT